MFLNMLNLTNYVIVNGRFEIHNPTSIPATVRAFIRDRTTSTNYTVSRTIVDYFTVDKIFWSSIKNCTVHHGSQLDTEFNPACPHHDPAEYCDHGLPTIEIVSPTPSQHHNTALKPTRTSFLTSKLKDTETFQKFQDKLKELSELNSDTSYTKMEAKHLKFQQKQISQKTYMWDE